MWKWRALLAVTALVLAAALAVYHYQAADLTGISPVLYIIFLTAALVLLAVIVVETCRQLARAVRHKSVDTDFLFLVLWIAVMLTGTIAILPHATAKYALTFLAPVILIIFRELEAVPLSESWIRAAAIAAVVLTFFTGTAVAIADYQLASSYRDFVRDLPSRYRTQGSVWFIGEWGFRHYLEADGGRYLSSTNEDVAEGDIIVSPSVADWPLADSVASRMRLVETVEAESAFPVRVMGTEASAGFYGTHWGMLPFALTTAPVEQFEVFLVGPPPAS